MKNELNREEKALIKILIFHELKNYKFEEDLDDVEKEYVTKLKTISKKVSVE